VCLLSGSTGINLNYYPVDGDTQNPLPSNVVCVSNDVVKDFGPTFGFTGNIWDFKVYFDAPEIFIAYNQSALNAILMDMDIKKVDTNRPSGLVDLFDLLVTKHVKGILKVESLLNSWTMDRFQYQAHQVRLGMQQLRKSPSLVIS
jgi:hypothetical protein